MKVDEVGSRFSSLIVGTFLISLPKREQNRPSRETANQASTSTKSTNCEERLTVCRVVHKNVSIMSVFSFDFMRGREMFVEKV
jgi:hypothetical protein